MRRSLFIVANSLSYFLSHRLRLAQTAQENGFDVHIVTPSDAPVELIHRYGFHYHNLPLSRSGKNLIKEFKSFLYLYNLFKDEKPTLVHTVTIKPVLYGGIAARLARVPGLVSAISGLGTIFIDDSLKGKFFRSFIHRLYIIAMKHPNHRVIFQNRDDRNTLTSINAVQESHTRIIRGSGVDLNLYKYVKEQDSNFVVTMASRLLKDKGVYEFVEAARVIHQRGYNVEFRLMGEPDKDNPSSVTTQELELWRQENEVVLLGFRSDVYLQYAQSNIVCLPSYREGLPKCLIEAAACGRAVVTTNVPGCRDAIEPGVSGLLVPVKNARKLADAIQTLLDDSEQRKMMGTKGRALAKTEFDIERIVEQHLEIYRELV